MEKRTNKKGIYVFFLIVVIAANFVMFKYPDKIGWKYTIASIKEKKEINKELESNLKLNETQIEDSLNNLDSKKTEKQSVSKKYENIRKQVNENSFKLHYPSLLIDLEKNARISKVDLVIDYNNIKNSDSMGVDGMNDIDIPIEPEKDIPKPEGEDIDKEVIDEKDGKGGQEETKELEKTEDNTDEKDKELNKAEEKTIKKEKEREQRRLSLQTPTIPGVMVVTIPLKITGSYSNIRSYIKFLDEVDMLEPALVDIISNGKEITAEILINVFYGEEGIEGYGI